MRMMLRLRPRRSITSFCPLSLPYCHVTHWRGHMTIVPSHVTHRRGHMTIVPSHVTHRRGHMTIVPSHVTREYPPGAWTILLRATYLTCQWSLGNQQNGQYSIPLN